MTLSTTPRAEPFTRFHGSQLLLGLLADKWTIPVIHALARGTRRFGELQREIGGVSQKVLTQCVRRLERHGLLVRTVYAEVPPRVEYRLTPLGLSLNQPLAGLCRWVEENGRRLERQVTRLALLVSLCNALAPIPALAQAHPELARQVAAAESSFAASMASRDLAAFGEYVAADAVFFGGQPLRGKEAVIRGWQEYFVGPSAPFSWQPEIVEVLESGDLALSSGPVFSPDGGRIGTFNSIWRHEPDGRWRVIFDKGAPFCPPRQ